LKPSFFSSLLLLLALSPLNALASQLEQIKQKGELIVLSRYTPTAYHHKGHELIGLEYELAKRFADRLGVKLSIILPKNISHLSHLLTEGHADIAAAGLTITEQRKKQFRFGPPYQEITQKLVYRQGNRRPKRLSALQDRLIEVAANSSHVEQLEQHKKEFPNLNWIETKQLSSGALLELVQLEMVDYTIADSNELKILQNYYPELRAAFDVSPPQSLAWAIAPSDDTSLIKAINTFFKELEDSGELERLKKQYYSHIKRFDYVDTRAFYRRLITELPKYKPLLKQAAKQYDLDWHLLAAVGYQESHWDPDAISYTGVKGLMMITKATAKQMKIQDRKDPKQSIFAGAAYINFLKKRLPERIAEPDKTWLALAAYNVGIGHLEDARILTQQQGFNPDHWQDVKQHLPLLAKKKWYSQTRNGYARGREPVKYIQNIRRYYDILLYDKYGSGQTNNKQNSRLSEHIPNAL